MSQGLIQDAVRRPGKIVVLTGAGISAESGIPTFRGEEGYWVVGSENYRPEDLARHSAFERIPDEIWSWYLYRRAVCRKAAPNAAHEAVAKLEALGEKFVLITQNVDGLHRRAGSTRPLEIHGNIDYMRCTAGCSPRRRDMFLLPDEIPIDWERHRPIGDAERKLLVCPRCGARARPHVLWFDECYDEELFWFASSLKAAEEAELLIVVGTSGATNLPTQVVDGVASRKKPVIVVNIEESAFSRDAKRSGGLDLHGKACDIVPVLVQNILTTFEEGRA